MDYANRNQKKLGERGDMLTGNSVPGSKSIKQKRKNFDSKSHDTEGSSQLTKSSSKFLPGEKWQKRKKKMMKKKKKKETVNEGVNIGTGSIQDEMKPRVNRHIQELKEVFGLTDNETKKEAMPAASNSPKIIETVASKILNKKIVPEVVVFENPVAKKEKTSKPEKILKPQKKPVKDTAAVIDFNKARFEVHKFGISGLNKEEKEKANVELAVKLGAKVPKTTYSNYKEHKERLKQEKAAMMEKREIDRKLHLKVVKPKLKSKPTDINRVKGLDSMYGKLEKKDVKRLLKGKPL